MDKMLPFCVQFVAFIPISADSQAFAATFFDCDDVRQGNSGRFAIFIDIFKPFKVQIDVHFKDFEPVIRLRTESHLLGNLLLNFIKGIVGFTQVNVGIEPGNLEFAHLIFGFTHHMGDTVSRMKVRGPIGDNQILSRNKDGGLAVQAGVKVDLLESITGQSQAPQHALMLRPELSHHICKLIVHVSSHPGSRLFLLRCFFAYDLGLHRASGREGGHHNFGLELYDGLSQKRMVDTTSPNPGVGPLFYLQS